MPRPLVVRLRHWIGDAVLGVPALRLLESAGHELVLVGKPWAGALLAGEGWKVEKLAGGTRERIAQLRALRRAARERDPGFDRRLNAVVFPFSFGSALEARLAGLRAMGYAYEGRSLLLARALPLPPVARHQGPLAYSPPDPDLAAFFAGLGSPIPVADDRVFETLWSCSAMIATLYRLVAETAAWSTAQGVPRDAAARYAATMTHAIAQPLAAADADPASLAALAQTPGGLNAQVLDDLTAAGQFTAIHAALDRVRARLDAQAASDG